ncbi:MAG: hypothetical protein D4R84_02585 [Rhodocyclaceae bacterium]|nr:MAG: hypothetical protein D4R84_02585 [Rhodocyclaceae bacterium]
MTTPSDRDQTKPVAHAGNSPAGRANLALVDAFAQRLHACMNQAGYPDKPEARYKKLAKQFGVGLSTARKWGTGQGLPGPVHLIAMAAEFQTSTDDLLNPDTPISPPKVQRLSVYKRLDDGQFEKYSSFFIDREAFKDRGAVGVICWVDAPLLGVRSGDMLFVDTSCRQLGPDGFYMIRDDANDFICRITRRVKSEFLLSYSFQGSDEVVQQSVTMKDFVFRATWVVNAQANKKLLVLGQVTWVQKRLT